MTDEQEKVEETPSLDDALSIAYDDNTKEAEAPVVEATDSEPVAEVTDEEPVVEVPEVVLPEHWSDEDKTAYEAMDESGREWALRLENNAHKGIQEKAEALKRFDDAFDEYKHLIPEGTDKTQVIKQLLNAQAILQRDPRAGIEWLKANYGIADEQPAPVEDEFLDPEVKKLRTEIEELKSLSARQAQQEEQTRQNSTLAMIAEFRDAKTEDGDSKYPHFNEVIGVMGGLLSAGKATDMEDAYNRAVWAVPEYQDTVIQQRIEDKLKAETERKDKEAKAAKKTATTVRGSQSAQTQTGPKSLEDSLSENFDKSIRGEL